MKVADLLRSAEAMAHAGDDQITLERHVYLAHFEALRQAYRRSGLVLLDPGSKLVPGYDEEGVHLQVQLFPLSSGEMFGSRYLMKTAGEEHIDEVDILMFNHRFDMTAGRLKLPGSERVIDYTATPARIQQVTGLVLELCQDTNFSPERPLTLLEMPK